MKNINELLIELESLPTGYISKKNIHGKDYFYLQYKNNGKLVSKYIKEDDLEKLKADLKRREEIEKEIKSLLAKEKNLNSLSKTTLELSGYVMEEDRVVAEFDKGMLVSIDNDNAPLIIKRTHDLISFLSSRILDTSRTNARLLKRIMNVHGEEEYLIALKNHATSVTDNYWFRSKNSRLKYKDVSLESDIYNEVSLKGELLYFPKEAKLSPQFSLLGSYEKCWKLNNDEWWMYKSETKEEMYSELIASKISLLLNIPTAFYEIDGDYIRTKNFATKYNFEPISSLAGDNDSFEHIFNLLLNLDKKLAKQYLKIIYFDALVNNVDRHNENLGFLRDKKNGRIVSLAPNFDLNMSLFARNTLLSQTKDGFISLFIRFVEAHDEVRELFKESDIPSLNETDIDTILSQYDLSKWSLDIKGYLLYREKILKKACNL
ncbi:MAG: HipA domain-containing protein [Bacilli bacterium]|nr:HipA domain-containing protein [Bacilli bacterium]